MKHIQLNRYHAQSWLELPFLVEQFVQRVAPALKCPLPEMREIISVDLELDDYESLSKVCRMMSQVYTLLVRARNDIDFESVALDNNQTGLAGAILSAWHGSDESMAGLQAIDETKIEPMVTLPWRVWAVWKQRDVGDSRLIAESKGKEDFGIEDAFEVLDEFMECCHEWRQNILDSYTLVNDDTPLGIYAVDAAAELVDLLEGPNAENFEEKITRVLLNRGFCYPRENFLQAILEDSLPEENLNLTDQELKIQESLVDRIENGQSVIQVRELREHFRGMRAELVDGAYEDGPCLWQILAHVNDDAYLTITCATGNQGEQFLILPWRTVYVEREADIPTTLRCTGKGAIRMDVVTRSEALKNRVPEIAGWYAITWWE